MTNIDIYTKSYCPFCRNAKTLLDAKGLNYREIEISTNVALQQEMQVRSGRYTVPQVFINDHHIGGSDDLAAADANGTLDEFIGLPSAANA